MIFTTQSESVPLVDANSFANGSPARRTASFSGSVWYTSTSVREAA
jgi:hypothetical protein